MMDTDFILWKEEFIREEDVQTKKESSERRINRERRKEALDLQ
jgi:hypothetical protein